MFSIPALVPFVSPLTLNKCHSLLVASLAPVTANTTQCQTEADWLLAHVTGVSKTQWLTHPNTLVTPEALSQLNLLLQQRIVNRCPIQYLLGEAIFYGLRFTVTPAVLIPRPETELLLEAAVTEALRRLRENDKSLTIVDVGTGSGCIPIALGHTLRSQLSNDDWQRIELMAMDCSAEALAVARKNAEQHSLPITFLQGNWLEPLLAEDTVVDMLLSNPPYIASTVCDGLAPEVIGHEPRLALDGGPDGLGPYRALLGQAKGCLAANAWLGFEFGDGQAHDLSELVTQAGFSHVHIHRDFSGTERFFTAQQAGLINEYLA